MHISGGSSVTFTNCTLTGNTGTLGGVVYVKAASATFISCTITGNSAGQVSCCTGYTIDIYIDIMNNKKITTSF